MLSTSDILVVALGMRPKCIEDLTGNKRGKILPQNLQKLDKSLCCLIVVDQHNHDLWKMQHLLMSMKNNLSYHFAGRKHKIRMCQTLRKFSIMQHTQTPWRTQSNLFLLLWSVQMEWHCAALGQCSNDILSRSTTGHPDPTSALLTPQIIRIMVSDCAVPRIPNPEQLPPIPVSVPWQ